MTKLGCARGLLTKLGMKSLLVVALLGLGLSGCGSNSDVARVDGRRAAPDAAHADGHAADAVDAARLDAGANAKDAMDAAAALRLMPPPDRKVACGGEDDTAALQSALDLGGVIEFIGHCKVKSLFLEPETYLYGAGNGKDCASAPSAIEGTSGYDVIHFGAAGNADFNGPDYLGYFNLCGGRNGIVSDASATYVTLDHLVIEDMSGDGITIKGGIEEWNTYALVLRHNDVGFHAWDDIGTRDQSRMDKVVLAMTAENNRVGAILGAHYQNSITLDSVIARSNTEDGIRITGESRGLVLIGPSASANGGCDLSLPAGYCKEGILVSGGSLESACSVSVQASNCQNGYPPDELHGLSFNQTKSLGTVSGTVHEIAQGSLPLLASLPEISRTGTDIYPVACGGVDDTSALQSAIDSGRPVYFTGLCQVRTLVLTSGTTLFGGGISLKKCEGARSVLKGTSGYDILEIAVQGADTTSSIRLYNFNTCYGRSGLVSNGTSSDISVDSVVITATEGDGVGIRGSADHWLFRAVAPQGQVTGFHVYGDPGSAGLSRFSDSSIQLRADFNHQAVVLAAKTMSSLVFPDFQVHRNFAGNDEAMLISGAVDDLRIVAPYTENNTISTATDFAFTGAANKTAYFYAGTVAIGTQKETYSIDTTGASKVTVVGSVAWRPFNDPANVVTWP